MKALYIAARILGWFIICIGFGLLFAVEKPWGWVFVTVISAGIFVSDYGTISREKYEALREDYESLKKHIMVIRMPRGDC